jgi:hypothetical protein
MLTSIRRRRGDFDITLRCDVGDHALTGMVRVIGDGVCGYHSPVR